MSEPLVFYPRALVGISGYAAGNPFEDVFIPKSVSVTRKPHTHAAECSIEVHGSAIPLLIRQLESATVAVFIGNAASMDGGIQDRKNLRFVGDVDEPDGELSDKTPVARLMCRDLSAYLRNVKPVPVAAIPRYTDTVRQAIQRVLDAVPGAANRLSLREVPGLNIPLSSATSKRGVGGPIRLKPQATAWDAIAAACDLVAQLVSVELDEIVVRSPADAFGDPGSSDAAPPAATFVYGSDDANLMRVAFNKHLIRNRKGVRLVSYDPVTRQEIHSDYPPDNKLPPRRLPRPIRAGSKKHKTAVVDKPPDRDVFWAGSVHTQDALDRAAERTWRERGAQELAGSLSSPIFDDSTLGLKNGDRIVIAVRPDLEAEVRGSPDEQKQVDFLVRTLGIGRDTAQTLARAIRKRQSDLYYSKNVHLEWFDDQRPTVKVDFINLIAVPA